MAILEAVALAKEYQLGEHTVHALRGVDLAVQEGEFLAIMGPSGSGKSTLLHLLGGLDKPTSGDVVLAGESLAVLGDDETTLARRHKVGFVFQFFNLLPTLTAQENVALPLFIDGQSESDYAERVRAILDRVGLAGRYDHKPDQLSGGEQQRVSIARAFVTGPAIVLADEPTGNLDSTTGRSIMELLRRSCDETGQTIIMVTHDSRAAAYADRIVFLRDGHIVGTTSWNDGMDLNARFRVVVAQMEELEL
ncbi:MAG: ABC transporter ATP-binding protein [Anaerolineales bacterium]